MIEIKNLNKVLPSEPYDVIVDRTSPLGSPFYITARQTRDQVCDCYAHYFNLKLKAIGSPFCIELDRIAHLYKRYEKVRLFCWCAPARCHAQTIKQWLEETSEND